MSTLQQWKEDVSRSWENLIQGWRYLAERAGGALTRYIPGRSEERQETKLSSPRPVRWGMIAAEVYDDGEAVLVKLEAPGMDVEDIDIQVRDDVLIVSGEKKFQRQRKKGRYHLMECAYGRFERVIPLPGDVDDKQAEANYRRGLLSIRLPKSGNQHAGRITVKAA